MKNILLTLLFLSIISCKDEKIEEENKALKKQIENIENQQTVSITQYVWVAIFCEVGTYSYDPVAGTEKFTNLKKTIYSSDILEIENFSEDQKFRLEDEFEKKCRKRYSQALKKIIKRETYTFKSYKEASLFKRKMIGSEN